VAPLARRAEKAAPRPQRRHSPELRTFVAPIARATPREQPGNIRRQWAGISPDEQLDMIGWHRHLNHRPVRLRRYRADDLLPASAEGADEHLAPPLGTPHEVGHHQVDVRPFMCVVPVESILFLNTARKAERPFIPRLKPGAFWPHSCNRHLRFAQRFGYTGGGQSAPMAPDDLWRDGRAV
jgi:hypothetical protein